MKLLQMQKGYIFIWLLVAVIIILAAVVWWSVYQKPALGPTAEPLSGGDTTVDIQKDLDAVDSSADLEKEIDKQLDADIDSL